MSDNDTAAALTEDEWTQVHNAARYVYQLAGHDDVLRFCVERILAARLAAQPPQDDPQPDEREALALARTHRSNFVIEPHGDLLIWTRVKCDGDDCSFYAEADRWYEAMEKHDAHVAEMWLAAGFRRDPDAGLRERIEAVLDKWERASTHLGIEHGHYGPSVRAIRTALTEPTPKGD